MKFQTGTEIVSGSGLQDIQVIFWQRVWLHFACGLNLTGGEFEVMGAGEMARQVNALVPGFSPLGPTWWQEEKH